MRGPLHRHPARLHVRRLHLPGCYPHVRCRQEMQGMGLFDIERLGRCIGMLLLHALFCFDVFACCVFSGLVGRAARSHAEAGTHHVQYDLQPSLPPPPPSQANCGAGNLCTDTCACAAPNACSDGICKVGCFTGYTGVFYLTIPP